MKNGIFIKKPPGGFMLLALFFLFYRHEKNLLYCIHYAVSFLGIHFFYIPGRSCGAYIHNAGYFILAAGYYTYYAEENS